MYPILIIPPNPINEKISVIIDNFKHEKIDLLKNEELIMIKKALFNYYGFRHLKEKAFTEIFFIVQGPKETFSFYKSINKIKKDHIDNEDDKKNWLMIFCIMKNFLIEEKNRVKKLKKISDKLKEVLVEVEQHIIKLENEEKKLIKQLANSYQEVIEELKNYDSFDDKMVVRWSDWLVESKIAKIKPKNKPKKSLKI